MFNTVLLTIDLNAKASWDKALPAAVELVRTSGGKLHIMSVVPDIGSPLVDGFFPPDYEKLAVEAASKALDKLVEDQVPSDIAVKQHLAFGKIHRKVLRVIEQIDCDLVVMASHKPDRVREFLVGSNADRIVRRSPVSVLVIRA
ncbi:universal stress protein [Roseovarius nanhaiticus]|uniref:Nucleotide-binding universal stress protein, UspA family n=1 Tax=Roseovarius nanhaiticus TaxID=573024 RepID=A0A1N7HBK6_9RHOB|nr:universal stress protein [Roseovarius nanhaiticus]SEL04114.1 Nucleotide-binding universal stress protein, UspA family [Roseovarius nanhaiticus]SIS22264.1 Nucleotide-binding universal stress protein, UspA family [Roseovarius nanhaiticus]